MVDRGVRDVQLPQAEPLCQSIASHQRREAGVEAGRRFAGNRQQFAVAPEVLGTRLYLLARQMDRVVVVHRLERSEALVADVDRRRWKGRLAQMTLQSEEHAHTASAILSSARPTIVLGSLKIGAGTMAA